VRSRFVRDYQGAPRLFHKPNGFTDRQALNPYNVLAERAVSQADNAHEKQLRRLAVQLAAQLPADPADALAVLRHCETLITTFLAGNDSPPPLLRLIRD